MDLYARQPVNHKGAIVKLSRDDREITMLLGVNYDAEMLHNRMKTFFDFINCEQPFLLNDVATVKREDIFVSSYLNASEALVRMN